MKTALQLRRRLQRPPTDSGRFRPLVRRRADVQSPFIVVAAGVPRSGSTWLFNAVRLLCERSGVSTYADWADSYQPEEHAARDIHLVKLHKPEQSTFPYHCLVTTDRDLVERIASLIRMGWVKKDVRAIRSAVEEQAGLHAYWLERTHLEIDHGEIINDPVAALSRLVDLLDLQRADGWLAEIARELAELPNADPVVNSFGHDATTLLHAGHCGSEQARADLVAFVRDALSPAAGN